ncbi:GTPase or GTP-binding protein-like protein [Methanocaldococcus fervens AG86]|uniref:polynucleotide 5'-hydroxyl-kinase n=2 Tax=Methanocaldococcus TaxID=196118 RepID=C7P9J1_METFA|nr:Clp1/GlmU family protein [Methanocaldococcus fervens]ACV25223.1 GTPase or GTP-binding protein-like protein [Methanocaldococcus fervens AG86]
MMNKAYYTIEVPRDRFEVLNNLRDIEKPLKILIVGGIDSGKTTLTTFLANELLNLGFKVAIIDCDIGQKSILPPATISLAFLEENFSNLCEIKPHKSYFVGSTSPIQFFGEMITGTKLLCDYAEDKADVIIIDTTGLISNSGADLKRMKIEAVKPDIVIALQKRNELNHILKPFENKIKIFYLKVYEYAKSFNRDERREIRVEKWKQYFKNSKIYVIGFNEVFISGSRVFQGEKISEDERYLLESIFKWKVLYGSKCEGRYTIIKKDLINIPKQIDKNVLYYIEPERFNNLIVGLIDEEGFCIGLGILKSIDFENERLEILSPISEDEIKNIKEIRIGRIKVDENGEELGLLDRDLI